MTRFDPEGRKKLNLMAVRKYRRKNKELVKMSARKHYWGYKAQIKEYLQKTSTKTRIEEWKKKHRKINREFLDNYKKLHGCTRCGMKDYRCIDFHHIGKKNFCLGIAVGACLSINLIEKEIENCVLLCKNCHGILHWDERKREEKIDTP